MSCGHGRAARERARTCCACHGSGASAVIPAFLERDRWSSDGGAHRLQTGRQAPELQRRGDILAGVGVPDEGLLRDVGDLHGDGAGGHRGPDEPRERGQLERGGQEEERHSLLPPVHGVPRQGPAGLEEMFTRSWSRVLEAAGLAVRQQGRPGEHESLAADRGLHVRRHGGGRGGPHHGVRGHDGEVRERSGRPVGPDGRC